ncbi:hypothetical protein [Paraflavitalea pollutisoli]|uniref:hypothetical protein n=1 Tax=Paraflavitalea pollutisoli TaxID=3034143 RepID=UPI0023EC1C62|nr:hypothetical protein [Paraflavitalea sp. H1-2-19X]
MSKKTLQRSLWISITLTSLAWPATAQQQPASTPASDTTRRPLQISGVYPHLALFNDKNTAGCGDINGQFNKKSDGFEGGIGAVVGWANQLWMVTYSPHCPMGSSDKLYSITKDLRLTVHPESIGGTPANRMVHRESNQLITSSYFIDSIGNVRVIPFTQMPGRMTATARHLTDPANKVYFYDMEGMVYEVDVHTLQSTKLFNKPVPGWHGKGAYTSQDQFVVANNGEVAAHKVMPGDLKAGSLQPATPEEMGVLASWNGTAWNIIERKQFTDVTGPGGIYGAPDNKSPLWAIGWDRRSVILKLLDNGQWYTYRLPKATQTYDHRGGWYTEWPRIREIGNGQLMMDMHGMLYDFPKTFTRTNSAGIAPISTHLRYIPDFTYWNGQLVLATDETTMLENPMAGRSQSNLWFGQYEQLKQWGTPHAWGGPWVNDTVQANEPSDAFLVNGPQQKVLHLVHNQPSPVTFTVEIDKAGNNQWTKYKTITVGAGGYAFEVLPASFRANWIRFTSNKSCVATAYLYWVGAPQASKAAPLFASLADASDQRPFAASLIRPAAHNTNLQVLSLTTPGTGYQEVQEDIGFIQPAADSTAAMQRILALQKDFDLDDASVIVHDKTGTFRLPKGHAAFDRPMAGQWPRGRRELESERLMLNAHGTFYEVGREAGYKAMRPVTTHNKKIMDFCTWRGLLVLSGTQTGATNDGHYFSNDGNGLWFGAIDDLWALGKPRGEGGVWKNSAVKAGAASLPFLMTGYDKKTVTIQADKTVNITLEVDVDLNGWQTYGQFTIPAGKTVTHVFPAGYSARWVRARADKDCQATVWFKYE